MNNFESELKYYVPESLWIQESSNPYNPIEWLNKSGLSEKKKKADFGGRYFNYRRVYQVREADVFIVPYFYNYYVNKGKIESVKKAGLEAERNNKKIVIWIRGDYDYRLNLPNAIKIIQGPESAGQFYKELVGPVEISDRFKELPEERQWLLKETKPSIGFVGQAKLNSLFLYLARNAYSQIKYRLHLSHKKPAPWIPHTFLRKKALQEIKKSDCVKNNFIIREKFWLYAKSCGQ
jgi:hypothetical protein